MLGAGASEVLPPIDRQPNQAQAPRPRTRRTGTGRMVTATQDGGRANGYA